MPSKLKLYALLLVILFVSTKSLAQSELAATLDILSTGVEVQRVNTTNFLQVEVEAIVGVGDVIRTDSTGRARITFFADGTDVTLEPDTEYRIVEFRGDEEEFSLSVEVILGQAQHRLNRILGAQSSYDVETPGMTLSAQGTSFAIRVEADGRSAMLVSEGVVNANSETTASVQAEFGIRSAINEPLSDVVRASTFEQLDAALDGCQVTVTTMDDVSLNVRNAPSLDAELIGYVTAPDISRFYGVAEGSSWYRIPFAEGFGWILSTNVEIDTDCAGLRIYGDTFSELPTEENVSSEE